MWINWLPWLLAYILFFLEKNYAFYVILIYDQSQWHLGPNVNNNVGKQRAKFYILLQQQLEIYCFKIYEWFVMFLPFGCPLSIHIVLVKLLIA